MRRPHINDLQSPVDSLSLAAIATQSVTVDGWNLFDDSGHRRVYVYEPADTVIDTSAFDLERGGDDLPDSVDVTLAASDGYTLDAEANMEAVAAALHEAGWPMPAAEEYAETLDYAEIEAPDAEGPMMNYYYPLPAFDLDPAEAALALDGTNCCLVQFENDALPWGTDYEFALALTGGGMDLSWSIQEAFLRLGYLAPIYVVNFPWPRHSADARYIATCALESARRHRDRANREATYAEEAAQNILDMSPQPA